MYVFQRLIQNVAQYSCALPVATHRWPAKHLIDCASLPCAYRPVAVITEF